MCLTLILSGSPPRNRYVMRSERRLHLHLRRRRRWSQPLGANSSQMKAATLRERQTVNHAGLSPQETHCHQYRGTRVAAYLRPAARRWRSNKTSPTTAKAAPRPIKARCPELPTAMKTTPMTINAIPGAPERFMPAPPSVAGLLVETELTGINAH